VISLSHLISSKVFIFYFLVKIWLPGSLEEKVQNFVKTWEMEFFHKIDPDEFKSIDPKKFTFSVNGIH